jgi:hypothetical protein
MIQARGDRARRFKSFKTVSNNAPPVSLEALYDLTLRFFDGENVVRLLLEHEPKIARYKHPY